MKHMNKTDYFNFIIVCSLFVLFIEIVFFHSAFIFSALVAGAFIYVGRKKLPKTSGKILFWIGTIGLLLNVLHTVAFKFLLIALFIYYIVKFMKSKKNPAYLGPLKNKSNNSKDVLISSQPIMKNALFSRQRTAESVFEWSDVNIQSVWGDIVIDLSYTVLPKGESVIFIRHFAGNIKLFVPYETEVSINHSTMAGSVTIFEEHQPFSFNQNICMQTEGFEEAVQKVKIMISVAVGDLEVKRI
ncbi:cell wall-active antibiotics response protein [Priestia megaterium]|nr:cell wall-active antibiotics response protein [Priestia megaterium]